MKHRTLQTAFLPGRHEISRRGEAFGTAFLRLAQTRPAGNFSHIQGNAQFRGVSRALASPYSVSRQWTPIRARTFRHARSRAIRRYSPYRDVAVILEFQDPVVELDSRRQNLRISDGFSA